MEDKYIHEFGIVSIRQEAKFNEKFYTVHVAHRTFQRVITTLDQRTIRSLDELRSFLTTLGINGYCSDFAPPILPTSVAPCGEISRCTVDDVIQWLTERDGPLELIVGDSSEEKLKSRLIQR